MSYISRTRAVFFFCLQAFTLRPPPSFTAVKPASNLPREIILEVYVRLSKCGVSEEMWRSNMKNCLFREGTATTQRNQAGVQAK